MQRRVTEIWFRSVCFIAGLDLRASGQVYREGPVLYVANHVSYLDIIVLGTMVDAVFVAKHDVADWPLLGRLARMRQCIFVTRKATHVRGEAEIIRCTLESGRNVILFPEGTTGVGENCCPSNRHVGCRRWIAAGQDTAGQHRLSRYGAGRGG